MDFLGLQNILQWVGLAGAWAKVVSDRVNTKRDILALQGKAEHQDVRDGRIFDSLKEIQHDLHGLDLRFVRLETMLNGKEK